MKKRFAFIKKAIAMDTANTKVPLQSNTTLCKWHYSIYTLSLSNFEDCLINQNFSSLIITGFPNELELHTAWEIIMQEYSEALGDTEYKTYLSVYKSYELLKINYQCVATCIKALRKNNSPFFCQELNKLLRINCNFNFNDILTYNEELNKCDRRAKSLLISIELKKIELENLQRKINTKENKDIDKNYFTSVLIYISKHNGYRITKDITVSEYCEYLKQYSNYVKEMEKINKK